MTSLDRHIVKIETGSQSGTGFVLLPDNEEYTLVVTATHVLETSEGASSTDIKISFNNGDQSILVNEQCSIVKGDLNTMQDVAVIVVPTTYVSKAIERMNSLRAAAISVSNVRCTVAGFAKATENQFVHTLYHTTLVSDKTFPFELQLDVTDPMTANYQFDVLIEGMSGCPIILADRDDASVIGLLTGYDQISRRLKGININVVNEILQNNGYQTLAIKHVETRPAVDADIESLRANSQRVLNRISSSIGELTLPRTKPHDDIVELVSNNKFVLVSGLPGVGKSAITKRAIHSLVDGYELFALQGEQLSKPSISDIFLEPTFKFNTSIERVLESPSLKSKQVLLLDSVEKILETPYTETIIDFLKLLETNKNLSIVITCRSYAVEDFKIRFLKYLPTLSHFSVPVLSDEELAIITTKYKFLEPLLAKKSLRKILEIPFNIDKATFIGEQLQNSQASTESDFKQIAWQYIIENRQHEHDTKIQRSRGNAFENIALARALAMTPSVLIPNDVATEIVERLVKDNLVEKSTSILDEVSVTHDIYEDWALTRFIDRIFLDVLTKGKSEQEFFAAIGNTPAIRRSFRLWIIEKIEKPEFNTLSFIRKLITGSADQYWKDECLVAILHSPYCIQFLSEEREIILNNNFEIFKRLLLLCQVACRVPDIEIINRIDPDNRLAVYDGDYLIPDGESWQYLAEFCHSNIERLNEVKADVVDFLLVWGKGVKRFEAPKPESRTVGLTLLDYLERSSKSPDWRDDDRIERAVQLLLTLAHEVTVELESFIDYQITEHRSNRFRRDRIVYEKLTETALSWLHSSAICEALPDTVIKLAELEWIHHPPTAEELQEIRKDHPDGLPFFEDPFDNASHEFGVTTEYRRDYSPASAFQTPIGHLLNHAPSQAISFIVKLFNHVETNFRRSDFFIKNSDIFQADPRHEIRYQMVDGTEVVQFGSSILYMMYRALRIVTPAVLQSTLMALEKYLLSLAKAIQSDKTKNPERFTRLLNYAIDRLLRESKIVSTTAVLIGVATAYPWIVARKILPLLTVPELFNWDLHRCTLEYTALSPSGFGKTAYIVQKERHESNQLPHRKLNMEHVMLLLGVSEEFQPKIIEILELLQTKGAETNWRFAMNRMDFRKQKYTPKENGFEVQTVIEEELQPIATKTETDQAKLLPIQVAASWARKKFGNEPLDDGNLETWTNHFPHVANPPTDVNNVRLFHSPGVFAAVGIRYFYNRLTDEQREWCNHAVLAQVDWKLAKSHNPYSLDTESPFNHLDDFQTLEVLPDLAAQAHREPQQIAKRFLFGGLILLNHHDHDIMRKSVKDLWATMPAFVKCCVLGLVEYASISKERTQIILATQAPGTVPEKKFKKLVESFNKKFSDIVLNVENETMKFDLQKAEFATRSPHYLIEAALIIHPGCDDLELQNFFQRTTEHVFKELAKDDNQYRIDHIHFESSSQLADAYASFLLHQSADVAVPAFQQMISWVHEKQNAKNRRQYSFVEDCLKNILDETLRDNSHIDRFWTLWEYLHASSAKANTHRYGDLLCLDHQFVRVPENWIGLKGRRQFFKSVIEDHAPLNSSLRLLSGGAFIELIPEGILWLENELSSSESLEEREKDYLEKLVQKIFLDQKLVMQIRSNHALRSSFIKALDKLIANNSASGYLIREGFIAAAK